MKKKWLVIVMSVLLCFGFTQAAYADADEFYFNSVQEDAASSEEEQSEPDAEEHTQLSGNKTKDGSSAEDTGIESEVEESSKDENDSGKSTVNSDSGEKETDVAVADEDENKELVENGEEILEDLELSRDETEFREIEESKDDLEIGAGGEEESVLFGDVAYTEVKEGVIYELHCAKDMNYVLDVYGGKSDNGANVQVYRNNGTNAQGWVFRKNADDTYTMINAGSGRVLDVYGGKDVNGQNIQQYASNNTDAQKWHLIENEDGTVTLVWAKNPRRAVDVYGGVITNSRNVQLYNTNGSDAQKFVLIERDTALLTTSEVVIGSVKDSQAVLDIRGGSKEAGGNLWIYHTNGTAAQCFTLEPVGSGYYQILNKNSGLAITVSGGKAVDKANVCQAMPDPESRAQLWFPVKEGREIVFFSALRPDMALSIEKDSTANGTNVVLMQFTGILTQRFFFLNPNGGDLTGTYVIRSAVNMDRVLDIYGGSTANKANADTYDNNWSAAQLFRLEKISGDTYYIINTKSGKALDIYGGKIANGTNVDQYTRNNTDAQKWKITPNSDGTYTIAVAKDPTYVLDIYGGSNKYKANVQIYKSNGTAAQKWLLTSDRITNCTVASGKVTVKGNSGGAPSDDGMVYLFALNPLDNARGSYQPIASSVAGDSFTLTASLNKNTSSSCLQSKFCVGVLKKGVYQLSSNGFYITNPEGAATVTTKRLTGANKKGIALGAADSSEAIALGAKHVAFNIPLSAFLNGTGYTYTYNGTKYTFSSAVTSFQNRVKQLNAKGIEVTAVLYMDSAGSSNATYITPKGRDAASRGIPIAGINAQEKAPRAKIEALFTCLATLYSKSDCQIGNWVIGNEVNHPGAWNWCGTGLTRDQYSQMYADVYRMANTAITGTWGSARVYISLDHVWTYQRSGYTYKAKDILDDVHSILSGEGPVNWNLAFHPYCAPELDPRIWNVTGHVSSGSIITPINLDVLTDYVSKKSGTHRIILSETGINSYLYNQSMESEQAAAIAYAYYLAMNNPKIDNLIIHQVKDDAGELAGGWHLGLMTANGGHKKAWDVFKYMDSTSYREIGQILSSGINGKTKWSQLISGFRIQNYI